MHNPTAYQNLFAPQHIMVIGASERAGSFGERIFSALLHQPFNGTLTPINPRHDTIAGLTAYFHLNRIPHPSGLALILTDPSSYDTIVKTCIKKHINHTLIMLRPEGLTPEQSQQLHKTLQHAQQHQHPITVCTTRGFGVPALGLHTHLAQLLPPQGKIALIGSSDNFSADTIHLLSHLPVGFSHFIDIAPPFSTTATLLDYLQYDNQSQTIIVQHNPHEPANPLFSALRQAARRKTIILHHTQTFSPPDQLLHQHAAERCGILPTFTDQQLIAAVRAAHLPKKHHTHQLHILSDRPTGWLHDQAKLLNIDSRYPEHTLPTHTGALQFCTIASQILQQDTCRALMLVPHHNWHNSEQATARQLARLAQQTDKPIYLVSQYAEGLLAFTNPHEALHTFAAQQKLQQLKKNQLQIARTPINPRHKPDLRHLTTLLPQTPALLKTLHLPTLEKAQPPIYHSLNYQHHPYYGAYLHAQSPDKQHSILPPFTTTHAKQLAEFFGNKKLQAQLEQITYTLNYLAYTPSPIQHIQFQIHPHTLHTITIQHQNPPTTPANLFTGYPYTEQHFFTLKNQSTVFIRALQPEDAEALQNFIRQLSDQARKTRFMLASKELPPTQLAQFCNLDYQREAAFIALDGKHNIVGLAQHSNLYFPLQCEFGISVSDELHGQGLAKHLMQQLIQQATTQGYHIMSAEILAHNQAMLELAKALHFTLTPSTEDPQLCVANLPLKTNKKPRKLPLAQQILAPKT